MILLHQRERSPQLMASLAWTPVQGLSEVLRDEGLYEDRTPSWEGRPRSAEIRQLVSELLPSLRRRGISKDTPRCRALASIIAGCRSHRRCGNGGCPWCSHALQLACTRRAQRLSSHWRKQAHPLVVSIVLRSGQVRLGGLSTFDSRDWLSGVQRLLRRAGVLAAFGALDVSLNDVDRDEFWQVHLHAIVAAPVRESILEERLNDIVGDQGDRIAQPVNVQEFDGSLYGASYLFKWRPIRWIRTEGRSRYVKPWLRNGTDFAELALFRADIGHHGRLLRMSSSGVVSARDRDRADVDPASGEVSRFKPVAIDECEERPLYLFQNPRVTRFRF